MGFVWYVVLAPITVLAAVLWERQRRAGRPKDERGRPWALVVTVAAIDGWLWWVASGAPWSPVWGLIWPLIAVNFVLAWVMLSDLTGVKLQGSRSAYLESMIRQPPERPRR